MIPATQPESTNGPLFDAYLTVDWSANNEPKSGKDSIWCCLRRRDGDNGWAMTLGNPATRRDAFVNIRQLLMGLMNRKASVLVGFDFAYGYPAGFARALGLEGAPWSAVWEEVHSKVSDSLRNENNRFAVAADFNRRITGDGGPFWGCHSSTVVDHLPARKGANPLPEFRITDRRVQGPKSVWQLYGQGVVGSQVLMGIPYLQRLRFDPELAPFSSIWPFETGLAIPDRPAAGGRIVHAEIYPSFTPSDGDPHEIKDARQVRSLAKSFADLDERSELAALFSGPTGLSSEDRAKVVTEEGWILGVA